MYEPLDKTGVVNCDPVSFFLSFFLSFCDIGIDQKNEWMWSDEKEGLVLFGGSTLHSKPGKGNGRVGGAESAD